MADIDTDDDNDASHAYCKRCASYQPVLWSHITVAVPYANMSGHWEFRGMECKCENCDFHIAQLGKVRQRRYA